MIKQASAQAISNFTTENTASNTLVRLSWESDPNGCYVIEQASTPDGDWEAVINDNHTDVTFATGFFTDGVVSSTNSSCFFKVEKVDVAGPEIAFVSPVEDEIVFDSDEPLVISISDLSDVDPESIRLYLDNAQVENSDLVFEDGVLTYTPPSGSLGTNGQEIVVMVEACDSKNNWSSATTAYKIATPLECLASSMLCIGEPSLGTYTYQIVGDITNRLDDVLLVDMDDNSLTFSSGDIAFFTPGEYVVSQVPTYMMFRKILLAEPRTDGIFVTTTNVPMAEIFRGSFQTSSSLEVFDPDAEVKRNSSGAKGRQLLGKTLDTGGIKGFSRSGTFGREVGTAFSRVNIALSSELGVTINGACMIKGNIGFFDTDLELFMEGELIFTKTDALTLSAIVTKFSPVDKNLPLAKTLIPVAPYVWFEIDYDFYAALDLDASAVASVSHSSELGMTFCLHARRKDGEWHAYADNWASGWADGDGCSIDAGGELSAKFGIGIKVTTLLESLVGPYISAGPFILATAGIKGDLSGNTITEEKKIIAGLEGEIGIDYIGSKRPLGLAHASKYVVLYDRSFAHTAPQFLWFPSGSTYSLGDMVSFVPSVYGDEPISYTWLKDGTPIQRNSKDLSFIVTKGSGGTYTCIASNRFGETRKSVTIDVECPKTIRDYAGKWRGRWMSVTHYLYISANGSTVFRYSNGEGGYNVENGHSRLIEIDSETYVFFQGRNWEAFRILSDTKGEGEPVKMKWTKISEIP